MGGAARTRARAQERTAAKAGTSSKARNARQKLAAPRAADRRAEVRKRLLLAGGSMAVVLALVATLIAVKLTQPPARSAPPADARTTAPVQQQVTSVPIATFNSVGSGWATGLDAVTGQPAFTMEGNRKCST